MNPVGATFMEAREDGRDALDVAGASDPVEKHHRYVAMVERFRGFVARTVPPAARVAVVSKGDDALLDLGERAASHFPRDPAGGYAGYHPASGAQALAMLQASRADGVEYVLFPATSLWWRETYEEFSQYLADRYRLIAEEDAAGAVYQRVSSARAQTAEPSIDEEVAQIQELVRAVLPEDGRVAVLAEGAGARCTFSRWTPAGLRGTGDPLAGATSGISSISRTADFLVVPAPEGDPSPFRAALVEALTARARPVLDHRHVCAIFDLRAPSVAARDPEQAPVEDPAQQIEGICRLLLPRDAAVVLAGSQPVMQARVDHVRPVRVTLDAGVDVNRLLGLLESWRLSGMEYLVVTPHALAAVDLSGQAQSSLDARFACRWADRQCLVFDLRSARPRARLTSAKQRTSS